MSIYSYRMRGDRTGRCGDVQVNRPDLGTQVTAILADPRLGEAMIDYAKRFTSLYGDSPRAVAIMGDLGRFGIVAGVFCASPPATATTVTLTLGSGIASEGRITSHIQALSKAGVLEDAPRIGRARPVRPSPWLEGWMLRWLDAIAIPSRRWWSDGAHPDLSRDLLIRFLDQILAANREGLDAFAPTPAIHRMMSLVGGHLFVLELILATDACRLISAPVTFSRRAFAERYGFSRSHAVDLCAEAERLGWLTRAGQGRVVVHDGFCAEARKWSAIHFALAIASQQGRLLPVMRGVE